MCTAKNISWSNRRCFTKHHLSSLVTLESNSSIKLKEKYYVKILLFVKTIIFTINVFFFFPKIKAIFFQEKRAPTIYLFPYFLLVLIVCHQHTEYFQKEEHASICHCSNRDHHRRILLPESIQQPQGIDQKI